MRNVTLNTSAIFDRLKDYLTVRNDTELAKELGETPNKISVWRLRNTVPYELLLAFCHLKGLRFEWVLTGEGDALNHVSTGSRGRFKDIQAIQEPLDFYNKDLYSEVGVYALAGAGPARDLVEHEPIEMIVIPKSFWKPSIAAIKVRGRSMEPLILDGAYLGIDRDERWIISGEIYAVWIPYEGAVIKRLYVDPEKITLKSDNLGFPEFSIPVKEASPEMILGRVKWVLQQF